MVTDDKLKVFAAVVASGSFTQAAHLLHLSQPAVSKTVSQLEAEAGVPLLLRGRGAVSLTPEGKVFHSYAVRILSLYESLDRVLAGGEGECERFDLGDGRMAEVRVLQGKIEIGLK